MSKWAQAISFGTNALKNPAAVAEPASRPPVLFKSALCVGDILSEKIVLLILGINLTASTHTQTYRHMIQKVKQLYKELSLIWSYRWSIIFESKIQLVWPLFA